MSEYTKKLEKQLKVNPSTASARLKRKIMFSLLPDKICYRCGREMTEDNYSIEHKIPWLDSTTPEELFFDLSNIAFSHKSCNSAAARKPTMKHGTCNTYRKYGCRCDACIKANSEAHKNYKKRTIYKDGYNPEERRARYLKYGC